MKLKVLIYIFSVFSLVGMAQKSSFEIAGDKAYQVFDFQKAIAKYKKSPTLTFEGKRKLAQSYYSIREYNAAEKVLNGLKNQPGFTAEDLFLYVSVLKYNSKYAEANQLMSGFVAQKPEQIRSKSYQSILPEFHLLTKNNENYTVKNLEFNTDAADFGPEFCNKQLVFASTQNNCKMIKSVYNWNYKSFLNLQVADIAKDNQLTDIKKFPFKQNKKWHEADATFTANAKLMAFTQNNYDYQSADGTTNLEIYFCAFKKGKWAKPTPFYLNSKDYSVGHPALSADGQTMFFVSNKPGGFGGTDIYRVEKDKKGNWGAAVNLGPNVNTESNEMFPNWEERTNTLYFASNGWYGLGGLDIYISHLDFNNEFTPAFNLGAPINSAYDDFGLISDNTGTKGYLTSNRPEGKGDDDIYAFTNTNPDNYLPVYVVKIIDDQTGLPVTGAKLNINRNLEYQPDAEGKMTFRLQPGVAQFVSGAPDFNQDIRNVEVVLSHTNKPREIIIRLLPVVPVQETQVAQVKPLILKNIYYDFDQSDILPESAAALDSLIDVLKLHPEYKVELRSHTDSRGTIEYNSSLSNRRSASAKAYLVNHGIEDARITTIGLGETSPVIDCINCDTREYRQNRLTEIIIPGVIKAENVKQTKGDFSNPDTKNKYIKK